MQEKDLAHRISQILYDRKAQDIVVPGAAPDGADGLSVIASGTNPISEALAEHVERKLQPLCSGASQGGRRKAAGCAGLFVCHCSYFIRRTAAITAWRLWMKAQPLAAAIL